jgi:xylulokinase
LRDTFTIFGDLGVPVKSIRLGGGGARSPLWRQIQADIYGMPVELVAADEGAAYGAALLAGVGAGVWPSVDAACAASVHVANRVDPIGSNVDLMNSRYEGYREVYPALRGIGYRQ